MYDDKPSPLAEALVLACAVLATYLFGPALASFWHIAAPPEAAFWLLAIAGVGAARWPWAYLAVPPALAGALYGLPWLRHGLALDFTVWYTDLRLGLWPAPGGWLAWACLGAVLPALAFLFVHEPLRRGTGFWSTAAGTLLMGHMWLWGDDLALRQYQFFLPAALVLWVAGAAASREHRWWKAGRRVVQGVWYLGALAVGLAIAGLAAWVIPTPAHGLQFGLATAWLRQTFPALEEMRGPADKDTGPQGFSLATTGFARRLSELGGPVKPDPSIALSVRFLEAPPAETLYLRGSALTHYSGRGWIPETLPGDVGDDSPPLGRAVTLEIAPRALRGATLFYPREISTIRGADITYGPEGSILAEGPLPETYQVLAFLPAGRPEGFGAPMFNPGKYLALPKTVPARVADLAKTIAAGKASPYDEAVAVEAYLRENTAYALDVPATPPGRDFVDFYLFDLKRGYCSYSATAMTVMLRTLGIPARWVQGFVVAPGTGAVAEIPWANAHAWVEAYFPGFGWASFDPTPRFPLPERAAPVQAGTAGPGLGPDAAGRDMAAPVPKNEAEGAGTRPRPVWPWLFLAAGLAAVTWLATSFRRFYRERIDWTDERRGLLRAYALLAGVLRRLGLGRRPHQTPAEYARSVAAAWPEVGTPMAGVAADVTAAQFAPPGALAPAGARRRMGSLLAAIWYQSQRRFGLLRTAWVRLRHTWGKD